jgi:hypothetical protein
VLHRKETFLLPEHELYAKFARLTAQEEKQGLLDEPSGIGTREGWSQRLSERGFVLKGYRLLRYTRTSLTSLFTNANDRVLRPCLLLAEIAGGHVQSAAMYHR